MKKLFLVFAVAGTLAACNNDAASADNTKDSIDSVASETKDVIDSSAEARKDMVDSSAEAKKDAVEKMDSLNRKDSTVRN